MKKIKRAKNNLQRIAPQILRQAGCHAGAALMYRPSYRPK